MININQISFFICMHKSILFEFASDSQHLLLILSNAAQSHINHYVYD